MSEDNAKDYYKRTLTVQMLDFRITELNSWFDAASSHGITEFMHLLPSQLVTTGTRKKNNNYHISQPLR